jgi:hypothetical protein
MNRLFAYSFPSIVLPRSRLAIRLSGIFPLVSSAYPRQYRSHTSNPADLQLRAMGNLRFGHSFRYLLVFVSTG